MVVGTFYGHQEQWHLPHFTPERDLSNLNTWPRTRICSVISGGAMPRVSPITFASFFIAFKCLLAAQRKPFAIKTRSVEHWNFDIRIVFTAAGIEQLLAQIPPTQGPEAKTPQLLISEHSHPLQEEWSAPDPPADDELLADREVEHCGAEGTECQCQELSAASGGRWSTKSCRSEP